MTGWTREQGQEPILEIEGFVSRFTVSDNTLSEPRIGNSLSTGERSRETEILISLSNKMAAALLILATVA